MFQDSQQKKSSMFAHLSGRRWCCLSPDLRGVIPYWVEAIFYMESEKYQGP